MLEALNPSAHEATPLLAPFLQSVYQENMRHPPGSYHQSFYSPAESVDPESEIVSQCLFKNYHQLFIPENRASRSIIHYTQANRLCSFKQF